MPRIEIPKFPSNKRHAVTLSFDDGVVTDRRAIEKFNEWGLRATWNLNSGLFGGKHGAGVDYINASEVAELYKGHEVAIHTVTHPFLTRLDETQIAREVLDDRAALEDLVGYSVRGMAYPFGRYDSRVIEILRALNVAYCRTVLVMEECFPPADPLLWGSTGHMFAPEIRQLWQEMYNDPWQNNHVFFIWGHTYEFQTANDWAALDRLFKPLSAKPDVWYCTNIELFDYEEARRRMLIGANGKFVQNPSGIPVTILAAGKPINVPAGVTIRIE